MKKLSVLLAALVVAPAFAFAVHASATEAGQIEGGDIYRVRNVSTNGQFTDPATATCGQTVQFKVRIHNIGAYALQNTKVVATLPAATATSHSSMVTVSASNANAKTDTAGVTLDKAGKLVYVAGSTELLDAHNSKLSTLADGITVAGVTLTDPIGVSTEQKRYVQFSAKVTCETVEVPKDITVCELATKKVITIKENQFDASKHSKNLNDCKTTEPGKMTVCELATKKVITINKDQFDAAKHSEDLGKCAVVTPTPEVLPNTGVGSILGIFAAVSVAAAVAHRLVWTRFSNR